MENYIILIIYHNIHNISIYLIRTSCFAINKIQRYQDQECIFRACYAEQSIIVNLL